MKHGTFTQPPNLSHKTLVHCAWDGKGSFSSKGFTVEKPGKHLSRDQRAAHQNRDRLKSCAPDNRLQQSNAWYIPAEESDLNLVTRRHQAKQH